MIKSKKRRGSSVRRAWLGRGERPEPWTGLAIRIQEHEEGAGNGLLLPFHPPPPHKGRGIISIIVQYVRPENCFLLSLLGVCTVSSFRLYAIGY